MRKPWTREPKFSVILAKRGSPTQGLGSTLSFPRWNHLGDSRAERENDVHNGDCVPGRTRGRGRVTSSTVILAKRGSPPSGAGQYVVVTCTNQQWDSRAERENDVHECKCAAGCGDNVDAGAQSSPSFRGRRPWNPPVRGTRPTVDARGSPSPPSSSRRFPRLGREPSEADRVRKGGAREREKLSPQGGSGVERTLRRRNPPNGSTMVATTLLKICCHSRAPRNPPVGCVSVTTTYCPAPDRGIPASRG